MNTSQLGYGASVDLRTVGHQAVRNLRRLLPLAALEQLLGRVIVAGWARVEPVPSPPRQLPAAFSDNVQRTMNLIMPLKDRSAVGRAKLLQLFMDNTDVILSGLRNVGTVHSARFDILGGKLCLFSVYDGDTDSYVRDFIVTVGSFFNGLMAFVEKPPRTPVEHHVQEFVDWVAARDLAQLPEDITEVCPDLEYLPRSLAVLLHKFPDLQVFSYSQYPSCTAAQIREELRLGW